jgi:hypothetical protein
MLAACASSPPSKPSPPADPELTKLTEWLKLDPPQQQKTRQLFAELDQRNAQIRKKWDESRRVRPEELLASRSIFERDFFAILNEDQKRIYADARTKLQTKGSRPARPVP